MHLIVDGNNLAWAGFHALRRAMGAETPEEKARATLLGLTQSVIGAVERRGEPPAADGLPPALGSSPVTRLTVAFDQGRPLRRRAIFPAYQTGREGDPNFMDNEPFVLEGIRQFSEAARALPLAIARGENTEADDLVAAIIQRSPETPIRIVSTDRDFYQLVDERVSIYSPVKRIVITHESFDSCYPAAADGTPARFPRERFLDYRAASGDASDNLPGIPGVGALTAARLLAVAPLEEYFARPTLTSEALGRRNVKVEGAFRTGEAREVVERNRALMDLRLAAANYPDLGPYLTHGTWDEAAFRQWATAQRFGRADLERAFAALAHIAASA